MQKCRKSIIKLSKLLVLFLMLLMLLPISAEAATTLKVHYINVGQGNAVLVQSGSTNTMIDTGSRSQYNKLKSYLRKINVKKIDAVVVSHPDEDHMGSASYLLKDYKVKKVYMNKKTNTSKTYKYFLNSIKSNHVKRVNVKSGSNIPFGKVKGKVLSSNSKADETNDASIVIKLVNGKNSFLFSGDASAKLEDSLMQKYDTNVDVLLVSHHGSSYSSGILYLKTASPKISVISVGKNSYGHPDKFVLRRLQKFSDSVYRTDKNGTIVVTSNGKKLKVKTVKSTSDTGKTNKDTSNDAEDDSDANSNNDLNNSNVSNNTDTSNNNAISNTDNNSSVTNTDTTISNQDNSQTQPVVSTGGPVIGNKNTKVYHSSSCGNLPIEKNRVYFDSASAAEAAGYRAHSTCVK